MKLCSKCVKMNTKDWICGGNTKSLALNSMCCQGVQYAASSSKPKEKDCRQASHPEVGRPVLLACHQQRHASA